MLSKSKLILNEFIGILPVYPDLNVLLSLIGYLIGYKSKTSEKEIEKSFLFSCSLRIFKLLILFIQITVSSSYIRKIEKRTMKYIECISISNRKALCKTFQTPGVSLEKKWLFSGFKQSLFPNENKPVTSKKPKSQKKRKKNS